jgi:hypothetical protein
MGGRQGCPIRAAANVGRACARNSTTAGRAHCASAYCRSRGGTSWPVETSRWSIIARSVSAMHHAPNSGPAPSGTSFGEGPVAVGEHRHARRHRLRGEVGVEVLAGLERDVLHLEGERLLAQRDEDRKNVGAGPGGVSVEGEHAGQGSRDGRAGADLRRAHVCGRVALRVHGDGSQGPRMWRVTANDEERATSPRVTSGTHGDRLETAKGNPRFRSARPAPSPAPACSSA